MPTWPFRPKVADLGRLNRDVSGIQAIQQTLLARAAELKQPDRVAHQYQIAGGKVILTIAHHLPANLLNVGLFEPASAHIGIGRVSTGLGCPHAETAPDFLGLRLAFLTTSGHRTDFIAINDPTAPTDTHQQFMHLLDATAAGAGRGVLRSGAYLIAGLFRSLGLAQGGWISAHVLRQTSRTALSSTACQTYWTGIEETGGVAGKFVIEPLTQNKRHRALQAGRRHLSDDWRALQARGPVQFNLYWMPFLNEQQTPLGALTRAWKGQRSLVGTVVFPQSEPADDTADRWAALAAEMGANPGNWVHDRDDTIREPSTEFGVARKMAYRMSQDGRGVLSEDRYVDVFRTGVIDDLLAEELERRRREKQREGHVDSSGWPTA